MMIKIDNNLINNLIQNAKKSEMKRCTYNFHEKQDEPIQRFLNAVEPESYVKPHKHTSSSEVFLIIKGEMMIVEFDDEGIVKDRCILNSSGTQGVEVKANTWHSMISLKPNSVVYIVMEGPYDQETHKVFVEWAPKDNEEGLKYVKRILES